MTPKIYEIYSMNNWYIYMYIYMHLVGDEFDRTSWRQCFDMSWWLNGLGFWQYTVVTTLNKIHCYHIGCRLCSININCLPDNMKRKFGTIIRFTHWMCNAGQLTVVWGLHSDFLWCPFAFWDHIGLVFRVLSPI